MSHIEEHHFEVFKVKHADGRIESMFLPIKDDARADIYNEMYRVQVLRQTCSRILCSTASRCQHLLTGRLRTVCRIWLEHFSSNLLNWADKGVMQLDKQVLALKKIALQDGANGKRPKLAY